MTALAYQEEHFNAVRGGVKLSDVSARLRHVQVVGTDSGAVSIDWTARSNELLQAFSDDSLPNVSGEFGAFLY